MPPKRKKVGRPKGSKNKKSLNGKVSKKNYTCGLCKKKFISEESVSEHSKICKKALLLNPDVIKATFKCEECNKRFTFEDTYKSHLENEHSKTPGSVTCNLCPVSCPDKKVLSKHIENYHGRDMFMCPHCDKLFTRQTHVMRHMSQKGCGGQISLYTCEICHSSFTRKDNLMVHLRLQHIASNHFSCKQCPYHTKNFSKLIIHWMRLHTEKPLNFECDHCGKTTRSRAAIAKHLEIHGLKKFRCDVCGYATFTLEVLRRHILTHVEDKPHKCEMCGRSYIQRIQLQKHMERHYGYICGQCGHNANTKAGLLIHKREHLDLKKLSCHFEGCPYSKKEFRDEASLRKHIKDHVNNKPYSCEVCGKSFHNEAYMRKHVQTHTLERPRRCMYCVAARAYVRGEQLLRHVRMQHRAIFRDHLTHVRQVLGSNVGTERVTKSELDAILNVLDAESERIIEGYGTGVLYGGMLEVEADASTIDTSSTNTNSESSPLMSEEELAESLKKLLSQLIDKDTLDIFGWPDEPVDTVLEKVIEQCGARAADRDKWTRVQRLRENTKHLFVYVIDDKNIARMLDTHTIDQIIKHILAQVGTIATNTNKQ
ncbi:oocyte zinc finger protein XlCOF6 [Papilio machaon]|uniref:oocyte zinc finger protein XlCOF6 n=1 Tax=Papilio machaon TaxID=76193 RepID=UPI001E666151|nr:oocyte zinc finger protein XlCOF6 [Papilio machaon]XP_045537785.1 oocyte zinc finger protein XlCOF6 [Papilio machaon]